MKIFSMVLIFVLGVIGGIALNETVKPAQAKVAGMDFWDLENDFDFIEAVKDIIQECTVEGEKIKCPKR